MNTLQGRLESHRCCIQEMFTQSLPITEIRRSFSRNWRLDNFSNDLYFELLGRS